MITLAKPPYHGYGYRKGQWFYAFNVLAEIDQPGEWYLDRHGRRAVLLAAGAARPRARRWSPSCRRWSRMKDASHVTLRGLTLEAMREHGRRDQRRRRRTGWPAARSATAARNAVVDAGGRPTASSAATSTRWPTAAFRSAAATAGRSRRPGCYAENNHIHHYGRWKPHVPAPAIAAARRGQPRSRTT